MDVFLFNGDLFNKKWSERFRSWKDLRDKVFISYSTYLASIIVDDDIQKLPKVFDTISNENVVESICLDSIEQWIYENQLGPSVKMILMLFKSIDELVKNIRDVILGKS